MDPMKLSLTGGAGGAAGDSGGTANNGLSLPINTPFNFDTSGWIFNFGSQGAVSTAGNTGANAAKQAASATPSASASGTSAGVGGFSFGGNTIPLVLGAIGIFLILSHKL